MLTNHEVEEALEKLPDEVADALHIWRRATIDRETKEAQLFVQMKGRQIESGGPAGDDYVKMLMRGSPERVAVCQAEAAAEAAYVRISERHLSNKKTASIRSAF